MNPAQRLRPHSLHRVVDEPRSIFCFFSDGCTDVARDRSACARCQHFTLAHELGTAVDAAPAAACGPASSRAA
jgi:hypothetical protein